MTTVPVDTYEIECVWRKRVVLSETRVFREGGRHVLDLTLPERSSTGRVPRRFLIRAHAGAAEPVTVEVRSRSESLGRYLSRITANEEADVILPVDVSVVSIRAPGFAAATCNVVVDGVTVADLVPRQGHETRLRVPLPVPAAAISLRVLRPSEARTGPQTLSVDPQTGLTLESINLPLGPCEIEYRVGPHLVVEWIRVVEGQPTGLRGRGRIVLHAPPDITPQDRLVVFTTSGSGWTARSLREISWPSSLPSVSLDLAAGPYALFIYEGASVRPMDITCRPFQVAAAHLDQNPAFAAPRLKVCRDDGPDWVELHPISVMPSVRARAVRRIEEHGVVDVHDLLPGPYWYSIGARRGVVTLQAGHEALIGDEGALEVVVDGVPGERLRAYFRSGSLVRSSEGRRESPGRFGLRIEPGELLLSAAVSDWAVYTWGNSNANNSFPGVKWVRLPEELVESSWTRVELVELEGQPVLPWLGWEPVLHESSSHPRQLPMVARSMRVRVRNSTHGGHVTYLVTLPGGVPESESWVGRSPR